MERYATWIQRSKGVQLDISINGKPFSESPVENTEAIMELIGPQMERCRSLRMDKLSFQDIRVLVKDLENRSLPQLKLLRIVELSGEYHLHAPLPSLGQLALDAPQLKEVELVGFMADFDSPLFHNLHALQLKFKSFARLELPVAKELVHKLLRQSPHLEKLSITDPRNFLLLSPRPRARTAPLFNEEPVSHPSLLDIRLDFRDAVLDAIIPSIRLPALRSFRTGYKHTITLDSRHFPLLIRNSPFLSLERIYLAGNSEDRQYDRYLANALITLPALTWIQLEYFNIPQVADAIHALGHLCPKLQSLSIIYCKQVDLNLVRPLVDMRLGAHGITKLRELIVRGGIGEPSAELRATKAWLEERVERVTLETNDNWL
ncbi:hypothetical protein FS837_009091 [Tulasnella sp. UAMH 9824]|nr:hypothetical protein FS837_009091 [Tulasnella sp. UAMH 9824]